MTRVLKLAAAFLAVATLAVAENRGSQAEEVVVTSQTAPVKVKNRIIGKVTEGERFQVLDRQSGWIAITIATDQGTQKGWVLSNHLQTSTSDDEPAPEEPTAIAPGVDLKIDSIQVSLQGNGGYLFARATIKNSGRSDITYDESSFRLLVDGNETSPEAKKKITRYANHRIYTGFTSNTTIRYLNDRNLNTLGEGTLTPGEQVVGWLKFPLATYRRATELTNISFGLKGRIKESDFEFDLRQLAYTNMNPRIRASGFDGSVQVVEVRGGLSPLNFPALQVLLGQNTDVGSQAVVVIKDDSFFVDPSLLMQFGAMTYSSSPSKLSPLVFVRPPTKRGQPTGSYSSSMRVPNLSMVQSETEAVIRVLAARPNAVETLTPVLKHADRLIRAAAASGLADHLANAKAVDALVVAAADSDSGVRAASVKALGGYSWRRTSTYARSGNRSLPATPKVVSVT